MTSGCWPRTGYPGGAFNPSVFNLEVQFSGGNAVLAWAPIPGTLRYQIYAGLSDDTMLPVMENVTATTVTLNNLTQPTYSFQVVADMGDRNSQCSEIYQTSAAGGPIGETIYAGFLPSLTPTADQVLALAGYVQDSFVGAYTLLQSGSMAQYSSICIPASYGVPSVFSSAGFQYGMAAYDLVVGGVNYVVYANPSPTFVTVQEWEVA